MSDSMCGPSTAFKGLVDHQNRDRSLQQEARGAQSVQPGTFRSNAQNASQRDQNFASFIDQGLALPQMNSGLSFNVGLPTAHTQSRPDISQPTHQTHQTHRPNDFTVHQNYVHPRVLAMSSLPNAAETAQQPCAFSSPMMAAHMYNQNMAHIQRMTATVSAPAPADNFQLEMDRWVAANLGVAENNAQTTIVQDAEQDFSEVNNIMDQLAEDLARDMAINAPDMSPPENSLRAETDVTLPTMGSAQKEKDDQSATKKTSSEISEVARQILTSVEHEDDEKWKNSAFLALMRDFRDGHKEIHNDEILESKPAAS
ncbi:hypothetical protein TD95_004899 [Thielaviopsis punctulata]|uniref:Peroxin 20 n=1 Tax=Thielaviopsis punctulata TaxID=72032 RepID=A0A0F4Z9K2_9PEZI|nr:hypothetical protein TD95_004899 [Thielaviopsis punctulata]